MEFIIVDLINENVVLRYNITENSISSSQKCSGGFIQFTNEYIIVWILSPTTISYIATSLLLIASLTNVCFKRNFQQRMNIVRECWEFCIVPCNNGFHRAQQFVTNIILQNIPVFSIFPKMYVENILSEVIFVRYVGI